MRPGLAFVALLVTTALLVEAAVEGAEARPGAETLALATFLDDRPTAVDPTAHYTLYLPPSYDAEGSQPLLLIFDPRGRARMAAELFHEAADRYGWILVSSNDTRSDTGWEPNQKALAALWPEISRFAIDPRRIYATGFSGGAIVAWVLASRSDALAGIIGVGGRLDTALPTKAPSFAYWGTAGSWDFNYDEMRKIDRLMERERAPHWLEIFAGPHRWMPAELATQAVGWMELVAMARGTAPRDEARIEEEWQRLMAGGESLEADGALLAAAERYRQVETTFEGLRGTEPAARAAARLEADPELKRLRRQRRRWDAADERYAREKVPMLQQAAALEERATVDELRQWLEIRRLTAAAQGDGYEAVAAKRMLHRVYTQASFYLPRQWLGEGNYRAARTVLTIALDIRDDFPHVWYNLACAAARMGDAKAALEALEQAVERGFADADQLLGDEDLAGLRGRTEFLRLLERLR
jgi:dienelactone hydrolase